MGWVTTTEICDAIADTLRALSLFSVSTQVQSVDEFTEAIPPRDCPVAQVYWKRTTGVTGGNTSRTTFSGAVRYTTSLFYIDYYGRERSQLGEDVQAAQDGADAIIQLLQQQNTPFFGLSGIREFSWTADQKVFQYTTPTPVYLGMRVMLEVKIF